jgi:hypothetical protein
VDTTTTTKLKLTDAAIARATPPKGKAQSYLRDSEQPGLALRMRASGGRSWVYFFTKPGVRGSQIITIGAWPKIDIKAARKAAAIHAGEVAKGSDPNPPSATPSNSSSPPPGS